MFHLFYYLIFHGYMVYFIIEYTTYECSNKQVQMGDPDRGPRFCTAPVYKAFWIFGQFKGFLWKMLLGARSCSPATFPYESFNFFKTWNHYKTGSSNLAILLFCDMPFHFCNYVFVIAYNFMLRRSHDGLTAKGLFRSWLQGQWEHLLIVWYVADL